MLEVFTDYTLRTVSLGAMLLGLVSGALGSFAMLRRTSLLGDAISHAALPGIAIAFLLTGSKSPIVLLLGAGVAGWIATVNMIQIVRRSRIKEDAALGLILSVFFGFGIVLLTLIQQLPTASQAGLDKFLFGQAATLMQRDVVVMAVLGIPALLLTALFWKELKLLAFNPDYGSTLGFPMRGLEYVLTTLLVVAIVIGLQTVGVVLMSAMLVAPAAAARQWTDRLSIMVLLAALFGAFSGVTGALVSSMVPKLPTGPTIVVIVSLVVLLSLLLAPNRGVLWAWLRQFRNRRALQVQAVMEDLYLLARQHADDPLTPHPDAVLRTMATGHGGVDRSLQELEERGLARRVVGWSLTEKGLKEAHEMASRFDPRMRELDPPQVKRGEREE
ncbi:iron chelate uptake ABC transporter family permease subunit [bacterium]|nr:iron chelate uptake ABC transporter family permease subunit [bacterium]